MSVIVEPDREKSEGRRSHQRAPALESRRGFGLRGLALAVILAALALGASAMALASLAAFQRTLIQSVDSRLSEVASEIARTVENGLQAGVALSQQRRLLVVMADERAQAPDIAGIRLIDERGRILFATNEAEIGEQVAEAELSDEQIANRPEGGAPAPWRRIGSQHIVHGQPLVGLFGEPLGTVTVALPKEAVDAQVERFALSLALVAAAITACGGLLAAVLLALVPLPAVRRLQELRGRLDALYEAAGRHIGDGLRPELPPTAPEALQSELPAGLAKPIARFQDWLDQRLGRLAEQETEVRRLDETA